MTKNGMSTLKQHIDDSWEIVVSVSNAGFLGKVVEETGDVLTLSPVFEYASTTQGTPAPGGMTFNRNRFCLPVELMASQPQVKVRWGHRFPLRHFDDTDRVVLDALVENAMGIQKQLAAARSGLTVVPTMPPNLPRLPGGAH